MENQQISHSIEQVHSALTKQEEVFTRSFIFS